MQSRSNVWLALEIKSVRILIARFEKSKSLEGATEVADAIKKLVVKHGWTGSLVSLRTRFERALDGGYGNVLESLK